MNILEFKKWLEQFPEETIIEIAIQNPPQGYSSYGNIEYRIFDGTEGFEFMNFTNNIFSKGQEYEGKTFLRLGKEEY